MTFDEFDSQRWSAHMKVVYNNKLYYIASMCILERLVGLIEDHPYYDGLSDYTWVRCENVTIVNNSKE
jgi:hypothetical protein